MGLTIEEAAECQRTDFLYHKFRKAGKFVRRLPHHNKRKTNYHIHLIFNERKLLLMPDVKIATRSVFFDEAGKRVLANKENRQAQSERGRNQSRVKDFLQSLIREHGLPPKPTLDIDMSEFRTMRNLMIRVQDEARGIRNLQDNILPKLKTQLAGTTGIFKGKERKALTEQIPQTGKKSVQNRLRQLQEQGRQQKPQRQSFDRDSR